MFTKYRHGKQNTFSTYYHTFFQIVDYVISPAWFIVNDGEHYDV